MDKDLNKLTELINSVKAAGTYKEVQLVGDKKSFDKLIKSGFPLENYRYYEISSDESKIFIIPYEPISIKICFESDE